MRRGDTIGRVGLSGSAIGLYGLRRNPVCGGSQDIGFQGPQGAQSEKHKDRWREDLLPVVQSAGLSLLFHRGSPTTLIPRTVAEKLSPAVVPFLTTMVALSFSIIWPLPVIWPFLAFLS